MVEAPCKRCKTIDIVDGDSKLCYECWCELDLEDHEDGKDL